MFAIGKGPQLWWWTIVHAIFLLMVTHMVKALGTAIVIATAVAYIWIVGVMGECINAFMNARESPDDADHVPRVNGATPAAFGSLLLWPIASIITISELIGANVHLSPSLIVAIVYTVGMTAAFIVRDFKHGFGSQSAGWRSRVW
jgi:hypothetical protein